MHDCCQGLDALWLIHKRISSRTHVEQCAESIMLAKIQWCTAHQLYSFNCYVLSQSGFMSPSVLAEKQPRHYDYRSCQTVLHSVCLCQLHMVMMLTSLGRQAGRQHGINMAAGWQ